MLVTQEFSIRVDGYYPILNDMNLEFGPGVHVIMGPNGVGKSTFAHALMGSPTLGTHRAVQLNGKDLLAMETYERARAGLFVGFQNPTPIEGLSNFQFMRQSLNSLNSNIKINESLSLFRTLADDLGLPEGWDKKQLNVEASGGEKKKNELIQLELLDPQVAILDEPDSGLDVEQILIGDEVLHIDGYGVTITDIIENEETSTVYNLNNVEKNHNFFAENLLVHNRLTCFAAGTEISLSNGDTKNIEDIVNAHCNTFRLAKEIYF